MVMWPVYCKLHPAARGQGKRPSERSRTASLLTPFLFVITVALKVGHEVGNNLSSIPYLKTCLQKLGVRTQAPFELRRCSA